MFLSIESPDFMIIENWRKFAGHFPVVPTHSDMRIVWQPFGHIKKLVMFHLLQANDTRFVVQ